MSSRGGWEIGIVFVGDFEQIEAFKIIIAEVIFHSMKNVQGLCLIGESCEAIRLIRAGPERYS